MDNRKKIESNIKNLEKLYAKHIRIEKENTFLTLVFTFVCFYLIYKFSRFIKQSSEQSSEQASAKQER